MPQGAADMMSSLPAPGADDDAIQQMLRTQRKQQIVDALTQASLTPSTPQNYGAMASRMSPLSGVAKIAEALMAKKGFESTLPQRAAQIGGWRNAMMGVVDPTSGGQPSPAGPSQPGAQPPSAAPPASASPSTLQTGSGPQRTAAPGAAGGGYNPASTLAPAARYMMAMTDLPGYLKLMQGTPEWQNALAASGGNQMAAIKLLHDRATQQGTITARQGETAFIPQEGGGFHAVRSPNLPQGAAAEYSPDLQLTGVSMAPGASHAITEEQRAAKTGENQGEVHNIEGPYGNRTQFGIGGLPGAPGGPAAGAPQQGTGGTGPTASGNSNLPPDSIFRVRGLNIPKAPQFDPYSGDTRAMKYFDKDTELQSHYSEDSSLADVRKSWNTAALSTIGNAEIGPLSSRLTTIRNLATEMGLPAEMLPQWLTDSEKAANTSELNKALVQKVLPTLRPTFGGRPTGGEFNVLKEEANPNTDTMGALAVKRLLELDNETVDYQKTRAQDYQQWHAEGGDPFAFEGIYSRLKPQTSRFENFLRPPTKEQLRAELARRQGQAPAAGQ